MNERPTDRARRRSGSRRAFAGLVVFAAAALLPGIGDAQLELLLRGLDAAPPKVGARGRYRFEAEEPSERRRVEFEACVERIEPGPDGSVILRLTSGDSLDARLEVAPALFAGRGVSLVEQIRSVVEISGRDTTRLDRSSLPGLDPAPPLPTTLDSLLGTRAIRAGARTLQAHGRRKREESRSVKPLGDAQMTQSITCDIETWTSDEAPLLGLVQASARIRSERQLSKKVAGVPESGPRTWVYRIELIEVPPARRSSRR